MKSRVSSSHKVRNILGGCLIFLYNEPYYFWGNLAIYTTSYALSQKPSSRDDPVNPLWVFIFFTPCWVAAMLTSGYLTKFINARMILGIAIVVENLSFFMSYLLIEVSLPAVNILFGIFSGLGCGFYEGILLQHYVISLSEDHASLFSSIVMSGGPVGGVFINQFILWYTNPTNLSPDDNQGWIHIFSQDQVISKVPSLLMILGTSFTVLQLFGLFLLQDVPVSHEVVTENEVASTEEKTLRAIDVKEDVSLVMLLSDSLSSLVSSKQVPSSTTQFMKEETKISANSSTNNQGMPLSECSSLTSFPLSSPSLDAENASRAATESTHSNVIAAIKHETNLLSTKDNTSTSPPKDITANNSSNTNIKSYTPREMLRSKHFYALFMVYLLGISARMVVTSFYKLYGQVWIKDDHFLIHLGTAQDIVEIPAMIGWGFVLDRIGVTSSLITMYAGSAISLLAMYLSAQWNKAAYFASSLCACAMSNMYTGVSIATFKWFGNDYFTYNVAIIDVAAALGTMGPTIVLDSLIERFGHFFEFGWSAVSCFLALVIMVVAFPVRKNY